MSGAQVPLNRQKLCTYCSEAILFDAVKCKYCKRYQGKDIQQLSVTAVEPRLTNPYLTVTKGFAEILTLGSSVIFRLFSGYFVLGFIGLIIIVVGWICSIFISDYDIPNSSNTEIVSHLPNNIPAVKYEEIFSNSIWADAIPYEQKVKAIGDKLVKTNNINKSIKFKISRDKSEEYIAYSIPSERLIVVTNQVLSLIRSDDELAVLLGHEIAHIEYNKGSYSHKVLETKNEREKHFKREFEADVLGTTLAKNAGYNPLASISLFKTILDLKETDGLEYRFNSTTASHPPIAARIKVIEYLIQKKYPGFGNGKIASEWSLYDDISFLSLELEKKHNWLKQKSAELAHLKENLNNQVYQNENDYELARATYNKNVVQYNSTVGDAKQIVQSIRTLKEKYEGY